MRRSPVAALLVILLATQVMCRNASGVQRIHGMNFAHSMAQGKGYGTEASLQSLRDLERLGVDAIAITPFGFQRSSGDTEIHWVGRGRHGIAETDDRMRAVARQAHQLGLRVMLKPHIWLRAPGWPGSINHDTEGEWNAWFASYREFILHYARLAEESEIASLCIGNELVNTSRHERDWRRIIADVRRVYHGQLTYGANVTEVFDVPFWDALDFIGVSAYFPLSDAHAPTTDDLARGWKPIVTALERLSRNKRRPVVFTELGYRSSDTAVIRPWEHRGGASNVELQARAYEAFFRSVWPQPWFGGVYIWKWESYPSHALRDDSDFPIENKPAAIVVRRYFRRGQK